jgi:hypothetical protein
MNRENNLVKAAFREEDFVEFYEIENFIKEAKPSFDDNFEKEVIMKFAAQKKGGRFFVKSVVAASLLVSVISLSFLFYKPISSEKQITISNEKVIEVLNSVGGREELKIDDILSLVESNQEKTSEKLSNYVEYYFGESDEEDFS